LQVGNLKMIKKMVKYSLLNKTCEDCWYKRYNLNREKYCVILNLGKNQEYQEALSESKKYNICRFFKLNEENNN